MKIMHISPVETHPCFTDLIELQKKKHDVAFVKLDFSDGDYKLDENKESNHITVRNVKKIYDQGYSLNLKKAFNVLLRKHKPDIVHVHVFSGVSLLPILNVASSLGIRKVLTLHDHSLFCTNGVCLNGEDKCDIHSLDDCNCSLCEGFSGENNLSVADYNELRKHQAQDIINQCDKIICPSNHQRAMLTTLFGENPNVVSLYYGVNLPKVSLKKKRTSNVVFGYLGKISAIKGVSLIEAALDKLKTLDFEILMGLTCDLGNVSDREVWERLKRYDKVRLKRNIPRERLYDEFFSLIDYLIIPSSWNETGPMTLFEAFHYKVPVIISDNESMKEKIQGNSSSIVFKDTNQLIKAMEDILTGKIKRKDKDRFPVKLIGTYAGEVESLYREAMERPLNDLSLRLGFQCNQNCSFCVVIDMVKAAHFSEEPIDLEMVENDLRKHRKDYDIVEMSGGEPTVRKDFFRILELAYRMGYQIEVVTNGRMLSYKKFCDRLADYNPRLTMICLHSANPQIHDAATRVRGSFQETVKAIRNLRARNLHVLGQVLITKLNQRNLVDISKLIVGLGVTEIRFTFLCPHGNSDYNFDSLVPKYSEVAPHVNEAVLWLKESNVKVDLKTFPFCCVSPEFRELIADPNMVTGALTYGRQNFPFYVSKATRISKLKQKFNFCGECSYNDKCEGVWKNYVARYGKEEFKPIK